ncbi:MAG: hypothetical protein MJ065_06115 [Oscillospiraceae bacterium]|nr:hypothetical protein [Oscillospiraceae bacterium]
MTEQPVASLNIETKIDAADKNRRAKQEYLSDAVSEILKAVWNVSICLKSVSLFWDTALPPVFPLYHIPLKK